MNAQPVVILTRSLYAVTATLMVVVLISIIPHIAYTCPRDSSSEDTFARHNMRQLLAAIMEYQERNGKLPFHSNGSDQSLYLLNKIVAPSCLASTRANSSKQSPYWDHKSKMACNTGWEYLNENFNNSYNPDRILLVSKLIPNSTTVYMGRKYGEIFTLHCRNHPGRKPLGMLVTNDGFLIASDELSEEWSYTAPARAKEISISDNGKLREMMIPEIGTVYRYSYNEENLSQRRVIIGSEEIIESVAVDEIGCIVEIHRSPNNWLDIWSKLKMRKAE